MHLHESFLLGLGELQELLILVFSVYVEPYIVPFDSLSVVPVYTTYNLATFRITNGGAGLPGMVYYWWGWVLSWSYAWQIF